MCLKIRILLYVLSISVVLAISCENKGNRNVKVVEQTMCLERFRQFADTLNIDTGRFLSYYLSDSELKLRDCKLDNLRKNFDFKVALVLVFLKIDNFNLRAGYTNSLAEPLFYISDSAVKLMQEYGYLLRNEYRERPEGLRTSDVRKLIEADKRLLEIPQIRRLYSTSFELEKRANKRFVH